jgi:hypothetical protein
VIAGHEYEARTFAHLAQELLQHVVVRLGPVWAAPHFPEVNYVTDQVDNVAFAVPEEVEQPMGLSGARTQMHVGDEDCAHA